MTAENGLQPVPEKLERLVPDEPLPPYSYVTGRFPHPLSDPAGHSFGQAIEKPPAIDPDRWRDSRTYCRAIDLFNHGYYWESHEVWEGLWHAAGRHGPVADFLKGLIKLAAAGVKAREGRLAGLHRHALRARELFTLAGSHPNSADGRFLGLSVSELVAAAERLAAQQALLPGTDAAVERVLDVLLWPESDGKSERGTRNSETKSS
jgi:hypothetical protein